MVIAYISALIDALMFSNHTLLWFCTIVSYNRVCVCVSVLLWSFFDISKSYVCDTDISE